MLNTTHVIKVFKYNVLIIDKTGQALKVNYLISIRSAVKVIILVCDKKQLNAIVISKPEENEFQA